MSKQESSTHGLIGDFFMLLALWLITTLWLWLGGLSAVGVTLLLLGPAQREWLLPVGGLAAAGVLLAWVLLLRQCLPGRFRHGGWQVGICIGFLVSQLAALWWLLEHSSDGHLTNYPT